MTNEDEAGRVVEFSADEEFLEFPEWEGSGVVIGHRAGQNPIWGMVFDGHVVASSERLDWAVEDADAEVDCSAFTFADEVSAVLEAAE